MASHARPAAPRRRPGPVSILIGVIGELLITAGVVLGLFVLWQLWWTDIEAGRTHREIVQALDFEVPQDTQAVATRHTEDPPIMDQPAIGTTFATVYIPRFGSQYEEPISQGIDKKSILDTLGIGHYPDTQMPGEMGNFAIAGHRTSYGKPFNKVADFQPGDAIVVRTATTWYVYEMTTYEIVFPQEYDVVYPVPRQPKETEPDNRYITLTACHPMLSAKQRYIVHGTMTYWAPVSEGVPQELIDAGVTMNGIDPSTAIGAN